LQSLTAAIREKKSGGNSPMEGETGVDDAAEPNCGGVEGLGAAISA